MNDPLSKSLRSLADRVGRFQSADREALIPVGVELEEIAGGIPDEAAGPTELVLLALEGLQALFEGSSSDAAALTAATSGALLSAANRLEAEPAAPPGPEGRDLWAALGRDSGDWPYPVEAAPVPLPDGDTALDALNGLAASLVLLDSSDAQAWEGWRRSAQRLAGDPRLPEAARAELVAACAEAVDDPSDALARAGRHIDAALLAAEDAPPEAPAPEPPPSLPADARPSWDGVLPEDADPALLREFVTECLELIDGAEAALLALETDPDDVESINTVFRAFHTIKGTSGFLGIASMASLAHRAESLLSRVRDGEVRCTGGYADLALRSADVLKEMVLSVRDALDGAPTAPPRGLQDLMEVLADPEAAGVTGGADLASHDPPRLGDLLVSERGIPRGTVETVAAQHPDMPIGRAIIESGAASVTDVAQALRKQHARTGTEDSTVRVRTDRLDQLVETVGELVIAQSMVAQDATLLSGMHFELCKKVAHAGKIVRELQDLSMAMRMVPLKGAFQKMNRLVRDLAHRSGKSVELITEGEDTEIDRNMVDLISDPLVHMVRNAVDHGIEPPDVREASGKPRTGAIRLAAYHAGGSVVVEISDDGRGLDRVRILEKAVERGLIDSGRGLTDREVYELIFAPGFSTAETITDISGRGVGMDVVLKSIEALRGRVEITSEAGQGSTFSLRVPLTLAVTDGMLVRVGDERYIVPTTAIHLSFRPESSALSTVAGRGEMVLLRGDLMPVIRLHRLFGAAGAVVDPAQGLLVVVGSAGRRFALLVDELLGQQQVVAKSLGQGIGKVPGVSGGAILGDGRVGLILDTAEVVALAVNPTERRARGPVASV